MLGSKWCFSSVLKRREEAFHYGLNSKVSIAPIKISSLGVLLSSPIVENFETNQYSLVTLEHRSHLIAKMKR